MIERNLFGSRMTGFVRNCRHRRSLPLAFLLLIQRVVVYGWGLRTETSLATGTTESTIPISRVQACVINQMIATLTAK